MSRKVYLSFLGLGPFNKERNKNNYNKTVYEFQGQKSSETRFVQIAEQELLGTDYFDVIFIATTQQSRKVHGEKLLALFERCGAKAEISFVELEEDMTEKGQWRWFEEIFNVIEHGDHLTVDLTHGYRSIPIIFSTAINFLQKTKKILLEHVLYGAYEADRNCAPIVDMRSFYDINIWADAMNRLAEDADAAGLAEAAEMTGSMQFPALSNREFVSSCQVLTRRIKNVDVNNVSGEVCGLMKKISELKAGTDAGTIELLELLEKKFSSLCEEKIQNPDRDGYAVTYFRQQLELVELLLQHDLMMQAFTVMRQWLSSLVMPFFEQTEKMKANKRRKRQKYYGDLFFNMLQYPEEEWKFSGKEMEKKERIEPWYRKLREAGVLDPLIQGKLPLAKELSDYRNGLDHAWIGRARMKDDVEQKAGYFLDCLRQTCTLFEKMQAEETE